MSEDGGGAGLPALAARRARRARRQAPVRWSAALGERICARVAAGELVYVICREPGMPTAEGIAGWMARRPAFGAAMAQAKRAAGRPLGKRGPVSTYRPEVGHEIFERLCEGQSLTTIGRDPMMPSLSTIFYWRRRIPEFEDAVRTGKEIQAELFCDLSWELSQAATPQTAYLTHVQLTHIRWMAGMMAPKVFRLKPVEPDAPRERLDILMRKFTAEPDPVTGKLKVVAWCPDPETGEVIREDQHPDWRPPPGAQPMPA